MSFVYILKCNDDSLYTGWTNDLKKRIKAHSNGKGAKYTKARLPVELVYFEEFDDKISAMKREYAIKQLKRKEKLELIKNHLQCKWFNRLLTKCQHSLFLSKYGI